MSKKNKPRTIKFPKTVKILYSYKESEYALPVNTLFTIGWIVVVLLMGLTFVFRNMWIGIASIILAVLLTIVEHFIPTVDVGKRLYTLQYTTKEDYDFIKQHCKIRFRIGHLVSAVIRDEFCNIPKRK